MTFWELLALMSAMATILGLWLTIYAIINNKTLKEESRLTRELINEMRDETGKLIREIAELIAADGERTRELLRGRG